MDILLDPEAEEEAEGITVAKALEEVIYPPLVVIDDLLMLVELRLDAGRKAEKLKTVLKKVHKRKNKQYRLIMINSSQIIRRQCDKKNKIYPSDNTILNK